MLIYVLQSLAQILAGGTSLTSTEQIDFGHLGNRREESTVPTLNLYVYDIRESKQLQHSGRQVERRVGRSLQNASVNWSPNWFDVSLLLTAWDRTALGEHYLISEALSLLLRHRSIQEQFLLPELRHYGNLSMSIALEPPIEVGSLWSALNVPLRPALYLTVTVPFEAQQTPVPLVWERIVSLSNLLDKQGDTAVITKKVAIAGLVKNETTNLVIPEVQVTVAGTEKSTVSNEEGLFFFDNLSTGNYILTLDCPGYLSQNVNILVEGEGYTFKEILLRPE
ncbi:Pvc16 family protein [Calothrix rhizosoleniae]|uniref:Pvc16 family protein n=1 Tax=Calothrix rhizosoleniae TaxID=888997 RepID=UPI000B49F5A2|nr:Pvc16 family protein [Calothrix rhizosoleniae]